MPARHHQTNSRVQLRCNSAKNPVMKKKITSMIKVMILLFTIHQLLFTILCITVKQAYNTHPPHAMLRQIDCVLVYDWWLMNRKPTHPFLLKVGTVLHSKNNIIFDLHLQPLDKPKFE